MERKRGALEGSEGSPIQSYSSFNTFSPFLLFQPMDYSSITLLERMFELEAFRKLWKYLLPSII